MASTRKTENGIRYAIRRRPDPSMVENGIFWQGDDGSVLELTDAEMLERDTSKTITDA